MRGICCVRAGVPGKTENVHIRSLVGRYLEHSRIYCFGSGEDMHIYIASGDFLTRNTERRVEVGVRVDDRRIAKQLRGILELQLRDTVNARVMQPDGSYVRIKVEDGTAPVDSQMAMYGYLVHGWDTDEENTVNLVVPRQRPAPARQGNPSPRYIQRPATSYAEPIQHFFDKLFGLGKK